MQRFGFPIFVVLTLCGISGLGAAVAWQVGLAQGFESGLTAALVFATAYYAYSTKQILDESRKQASIASKQVEIMLNGQFQAEAPVIKLKATGETDIRIDIENSGKGPALNIKCWIDDPKHPELNMKTISWSAVAVGASYFNLIITGIRGYTLHNINIEAQYESVFHRRYESRLVFSDDVHPILLYSEILGKGNSIA